MPISSNALATPALHRRISQIGATQRSTPGYPATHQPHQLTPEEANHLARCGQFSQSLLPRLLGGYPAMAERVTGVVRLLAASMIRPMISAKPAESQLKIMRAMIQLYGLFTAYGPSRLLGYFSQHPVTQLGGIPCKYFAPSERTQASALSESVKNAPEQLVILAFPGFGGICNTSSSWDAPMQNLQKATGAHVLLFQYPNMDDTVRGEDQVRWVRNALEQLGQHPLFEGHCDAQNRPVGFRFVSVSNSYGGLMLASALQSFPAGASPVTLERSVFQWPFMRVDREREPVAQNPNAIIPSGPALMAFSAHVRGDRRPGDTLLNPLRGDFTNFADHNLIEVGTEDPVAHDGYEFAQGLVAQNKSASVIVHDPGFHGGEMTTNWLPWGDNAMARSAGFLLATKQQ